MGSQYYRRAPLTADRSLAPVFHISPVRTLAVPDSGETTTDYLDFNAFCAHVDALPEAAALHIGGDADPLLHLHFCRMVRYAAARGMRVSVSTGLTVLPEYLAAECVASGLYAMRILLNAADAATYRELHGKDGFGKVMRNIRRLMKAKASKQHADGTPYAHLACTALPANLSQLPQLARLAYEENFDGMQVEFDGGASVWLNDKLRADFHFKRARAVADVLGFALDLPSRVDGSVQENGPRSKGRASSALPLPYPVLNQTSP